MSPLQTNNITEINKIIMQGITLKNVNVEKLRKLLGITNTLATEKDETISIIFKTDNSLESVSKTSNEVAYKKWNVPLTELCESFPDITQEIKCCIFRGDSFTRTILGLFGALVDIDFFFENPQSGVVKMTISKKDKNGKIVLKTSLVTAVTEVSFQNIPDDAKQIIFGESEVTTKLGHIKLHSEEIKNITKLLPLDTIPEEQKDFIVIKAKGDDLIATDYGWETVLGENTTNFQHEIEVSKKLWKLIDNFENYTVTLCTAGHENFIVLEAEGMNLKTAILTLKTIDESVDFNNFDSFNDIGFD